MVLSSVKRCELRYIGTEKFNLRTLARRGLFDYALYTERGYITLNDIVWNVKSLHTARSMLEDFHEVEVEDEILNIDLKSIPSLYPRDFFEEQILTDSGPDDVCINVVDDILKLLTRYSNVQFDAYNKSDMITCSHACMHLNVLLDLVNYGEVLPSDIRVIDSFEVYELDKHHIQDTYKIITSLFERKNYGSGEYKVETRNADRRYRDKCKSLFSERLLRLSGICLEETE